MLCVCYMCVYMLCVYMCTCTSVYVWVCVCVSVCVYSCVSTRICLLLCVCGEQRKASGVGPYHLPYVKQGVLSFPAVYCRLAGLQTSKDFSVCLSSCCRGAGITDLCYLVWLSEGSGALNSSPHTPLKCQAPHPLSYFLSPKHHFLWHSGLSHGQACRWRQCCLVRPGKRHSGKRWLLVQHFERCLGQ